MRMNVSALKPPFDGGAFAPLTSSTLSEQVADKIVEAIAGRQLVSGQRLIETELAAALQVSRVPIREAMRILESQGIIVATPRRGMRVATLDDAWARQLHQVRVAIERIAAHLAADRLRADPTLATRLDLCIATLDRARGDWLAVNKADIAFHTTIFEIAESALLWTLWNAIARHVLIIFSIETYRDADFDRILAEHHVYVRTLLRGTRADIDSEIERHVAGLETFGRKPGTNAPQR
jgi:DNA-binding GntR family transcriptional regulator